MQQGRHLFSTLRVVILLLLVAFVIVIPFFEQYRLDSENLNLGNQIHEEAILARLSSQGIANHTYSSTVSFVHDVQTAIEAAQADLNQRADAQPATTDVRLDAWKAKSYVFQITKHSGVGLVSRHSLSFLLCFLILCAAGGILMVSTQLRISDGNNDHVYRSLLTKGISKKLRNGVLITVLIGILAYGYFYMQGNFIWPLLTLAIAALIVMLVKRNSHTIAIGKSIPGRLKSQAWIGVIAGVFLIGFYVILYWAPCYVIPWITITDPLSKFLNGNPASQWFLYGFLYTIVVLVMGVRMLARYRNNKYQVIRTCSVMFFQTGFAFLIPEILVRLNTPYFDFKNIWPLNYSFFFDWNLNNLIQSGGLGIFMLVWGIALTVIGVPVFTYLYGKRWYCSWVCGCGGLAETLGDPFRHLSDKSLKAWKYERWIVHGVLTFAVVMTALVLYTYFTGRYQVLFVNSDTVRTWYGFLIGSVFAGVVGTGFYPLMGNRMWCRFGCPLAAYLGLIQRFKSRFRITVNGGQCISCGNCSTYCEMGIDVRSYAQRGQDVVRASCVGCGICASVCPRGVLRLENGSSDVNTRAVTARAVHIREGDVRLLG